MKTYLTTLATAGIIGGSVLGGGTALAAKNGLPGLGRKNPEIRQEVLQEQASWLGISEDQLWSELKDKNFVQVAKDHGKTDEQIKQHREEVKNSLKDKRQEKREEHKQSITNKLKEKGFNDDQIKTIFEAFESEHPKPDQQN